MGLSDILKSKSTSSDGESKDGSSGSGSFSKWLAGAFKFGAKVEKAATPAGIAQSAAPAVAYVGAEQIAATLKNISVIMILLGAFQFILRLISGYSVIVHVLSLVLFMLAGYALAEKLGKKKVAVFIPMLIFAVWYYLFNGNYSMGFILWAVSIFGAISIVFALFSKGESVGPELLGLLPVLFFFLDVGLLHYIILTYNLPWEGFSSMLNYMPWWAFFGMWTLPTSDNKNSSFIINGLRIVGIVYLIFTVTTIALPGIAIGQETVATASQLEEAQAKLRAETPKTELPFISNVLCIFSSPDNVPACVQGRQDLSKWTSTCTNEKSLIEGTKEFQKCIDDERKRQEKEQINIEGMSDPTIKMPTTAEFKLPDGFPSKLPRDIQDNFKQFSYPIDLKIENPRGQHFFVELNCTFTNQQFTNSQNAENFTGIIQGGDYSGKIEIKDKQQAHSITCSNPVDKSLNGTYKLTYYAKFINLNSTSRLQRAFIGDKSIQWKEEWLPKIKSAHFSTNNYMSQGPRDFARLNFIFGNSLENPIIEGHENILLLSNVENLGNGKITTLHDYFIDLEGFSPNSGESCTEGNNVLLPEKMSINEKIPLPSCFLTLPADLWNPEIYDYKEFTGTISYDYEISKEVQITVEVKDYGSQ